MPKFLLAKLKGFICPRICCILWSINNTYFLFPVLLLLYFLVNYHKATGFKTNRRYKLLQRWTKHAGQLRIALLLSVSPSLLHHSNSCWLHEPGVLVIIMFIIYATADDADAYMFYRCFFSCFMFFLLFAFSVRHHKKYQTTVLRNGWTDFHETFTKR